MKKKYIFLMFIILFSLKSYGFNESMLFFDDEEIAYLNTPGLINSEYYSDILAFRLNLQNHFNFLNADNAYDIAIGSISSKRFMINQRLKIKHAINDTINLHIGFFEIEDFEVSRSHLMFGLGYNVSKALELVVNTSFFSEKSNNDLGLAANYNPNSNNSLRFFVNLPDFSFNERTETNSENISSSINLGLIGSYRSTEGSQIEYYVLNNSKLEREFSDINEIYEFSELRYGLRSILKASLLSYNFLIEAFNGTEGQYSSLAVKEVWDRKGVKSLIQIQLNQWTAGLETNWRSWTLNNDRVKHTNFMPHLWYRKNLKAIVNYIDFGLEASIHRGSGPFALREGLDSDSDINTRFNLRPNFKLSKNSFLNLIFSLDMDDGSWEGGGGQFQVLF